MNLASRHLILVTLGSLLFTGCARIKPDEIGVRTYNFGAGKGIVAKDYGPGIYRAIWPLDTWNKFPRTVQSIPFLRETSIHSEKQTAPLMVTSEGGDRVILDAEVFFRIADGEAYKVLQDSGAGEKYKDLVRASVMDAGRAAFGQLKTEEFYDPKQRETVRQNAVTLLKEKLKPRGIEIIDFLIETIEFAPEYENLIKQKKISDQKVQLELSKAKAAEEKGKVEKIKVETVAKLQKIQRETEAEILRKNTETDYQIASMRALAEKYASQRKADADLYRSHKEAEGQLLKKTAEAEGTQRMNQALSGEGGSNVAALEAARNLQINEIVFPSVGVDWFNPAVMARRLGAEEISDSTSNR